MQKNVVVIPLRSDSKRLPKKNLKLLGGIPLFIHSIRYAQMYPEICHNIVISTDDDEIKEIAAKESVLVLDRPKGLAGDLTPTSEVLRHVLVNLEEEFDNIILLQVTNPFRMEELLSKAYGIFEQGNYDSLISVSKNEQKFGKIINRNYVPYNYTFGQRSQDLEPLYFENGQLYITKSSLIMKGNIIGKNNYAFIDNNPLAKIDIDSEEDFELAEYYYQKYYK